jgi:hypothetical protein
MMAQDVEVAPSFQPLVGLAANFLGSHESQVADPMIEALEDMTGADLVAALPLVLQQISPAVQAILAWWNALARVNLADPSTVCGVVEALSAQRYHHPSPVARVVGQAITALEAYVAEQAPTSTSHPARHAVEL